MTYPTTPEATAPRIAELGVRLLEAGRITDPLDVAFVQRWRAVRAIEVPPEDLTASVVQAVSAVASVAEIARAVLA